MTNSFEQIKTIVCDYYTEKVRTFGTAPKGVDWNSLSSQELRFEQLLKVCNFDQPLTLNDYGCGYGYLFEYLARQGYSFQYTGFDLSPEMVNKAQEKYGDRPNARFICGTEFETVADYTVASGVLNVKLENDTVAWQAYTLATLHQLDALSQRGFAFNVLTSYSDREYMRADLYYADPCFYFDYCKRNFSRNIALLHDYDLYEFTILVRKS